MHPRLTLALTLVATGLAGGPPAAGQTPAISWHTLDGGGVMRATGGMFELSATIGQADAGTLAAGNAALAGGFWVAFAGGACGGAPGDANCDGSVDFFDIDPFLTALFDPPGYLATHCGGSICAVDVDCSTTVDFFDIDPFLMCLFGGCDPCP